MAFRQRGGASWTQQNVFNRKVRGVYKKAAPYIRKWGPRVAQAADIALEAYAPGAFDFAKSALPYVTKYGPMAFKAATYLMHDEHMQAYANGQVMPRGPPMSHAQHMALSFASAQKAYKVGLANCTTKRKARVGSRIPPDAEIHSTNFEVSAATASVTWAEAEGGAAHIAPMAVGDTNSSRNGRLCHVTSLHLKGEMTMPAVEALAAPQDEVRIRFIIYIDKQTNGAIAAPGLIMLNNGTSKVDSFPNLQGKSRFRILYDKTFTLKPPPVNEDGINEFANAAVSIPFSFNKSFKNPIKITHSGTDNLIASITDNSFHCIAVADTTAADYNYQCRCRFLP